MAVFSAAICRERLKLWMKAEEGVATAQRYQIGNRMLTRGDLEKVREQIKFWANQLVQAEAEEKKRGRNRLYFVVQRDI